MSVERIVGVIVMGAVLIALQGSIDAHFESGFVRVIANAILAGSGYALGHCIGYMLTKRKA